LDRAVINAFQANARPHPRRPWRINGPNF